MKNKSMMVFLGAFIFMGAPNTAHAQLLVDFTKTLNNAKADLKINVSAVKDRADSLANAIKIKINEKRPQGDSLIALKDTRVAELKNTGESISQKLAGYQEYICTVLKPDAASSAIEPPQRAIKSCLIRVEDGANTASAKSMDLDLKDTELRDGDQSKTVHLLVGVVNQGDIRSVSYSMQNAAGDPLTVSQTQSVMDQFKLKIACKQLKNMGGPLIIPGLTSYDKLDLDKIANLADQVDQLNSTNLNSLIHK